MCYLYKLTYENNMKKEKDLKNKKNKKKLTPCNENIYVENDKVRKETGLTENAKILLG